MRRKVVVAFLVVVVIICGARVGLHVYMSSGKESERAARERPPAPIEMASKVGLPQPLGPKGARVKVKAYFNYENECQWETIKVLRGIAEKFPGKVRVEFVNPALKGPALEELRGILKSQGVEKECQEWIAVNGRVKFKVGGREVLLFGALGPGTRKARLLERIVEEEVRRLYGSKRRGKE